MKENPQSLFQLEKVLKIEISSILGLKEEDIIFINFSKGSIICEFIVRAMGDLRE